MSEKLLVPDIGDFEEVEVIEVLAKQGDQLNINDPVITIESDKSSVEIPSTLAGKIEKVEVKVGDKVSKGDLILNIASSAENKKENPIPKDTESIIKQAKQLWQNKKMRLKLLINLLKRKNNQLFKLQMVKIQIL
jgi:pyruvate dehydrogenase E1 component